MVQEMGHRSAETKVARKESEKLKEAEMEVDGKVPQEESVEIQSPKRKVVRVESQGRRKTTCVRHWYSAGRSRGIGLRAKRCR